MAEMNRFSRWTVNRRTGARARRVLDRLGPVLQVPATSRILELGAGGGGMIALLQDRYHPARLVGTDYDPAQVSAAREFLTDRWGEIPPSVELRSADALALPFPDSSFDFVFAMMMLHHVEVSFREYVRRPQALAEIRRVSAPSGRLIYSDMFRREEIRGTLAELGFQQQFLRAGWRSDLAVYRAPSQPTVGERTGQPVASA